uniref:Uncharacterized protein n=1 Tax=Lepeophtheirus salmonis TaxID=72036 RepID=A0A0K2VA43_LEPSM
MVKKLFFKNDMYQTNLKSIKKNIDPAKILMNLPIPVYI